MFRSLREKLGASHADAGRPPPSRIEVMVPVAEPAQEIDAVCLALDMARALGGVAQVVGLYDEEVTAGQSPPSEETAAQRHHLARRLTTMCQRIAPDVSSRVWVTHRRDVEGLVQAFGPHLLVLRAAEAPRLEPVPSLGVLLVPEPGAAPTWLEELSERAHGLWERGGAYPAVEGAAREMP